MISSLGSFDALDTAQKLAFAEKRRNFLGRRPANLLAFGQVHDALQLQTANNKGLCEIELDKIVGSVGRCQDFTRSFLPKNKANNDRWRRVNELYHRRGFEPIKVYKVSDIYFVLDGHHRVSVHRVYGVKTIEAHVIEFETPITIGQTDDFESILRKAQGDHPDPSATKRWIDLQGLATLFSGKKVSSQKAEVFVGQT